MSELLGANSVALFDRLYAAARRAIAANGISKVGRDGRTRLDMETMIAHGNLADILREIGGEIPRHTDECAAMLSPTSTCDCGVSDALTLPAKPE